MSVTTLPIIASADIRVRVFEASSGFFYAVASTEDPALTRRLYVTAYSRSPERAVAHALRELAGGLEETSP